MEETCICYNLRFDPVLHAEPSRVYLTWKTSKRTSKGKDKDNVNGNKQKEKKNVCLLAES